MAQLVKVLLAEGHQPMKELISEEIRGLENVNLIGCVQSGNELEHFLNTTKKYPNVILMDAAIEAGGSFNYTKLIADKYPEIKVIALADKDDSLYIQEMIRNGADGYILKESCNDDLNSVLAADRGVSSTAINFNYNTTEKKIQNTSDESVLNQNERTVLKLLMNQYSSIEIADKLSINRSQIQETIDLLNAKTNSSNPSELKRYAIRHLLY